MNKDKFPKKYQKIYEQTKDYFKTDGYEIDWIDEVYLPFWVCKQYIYVSTKLRPDPLSSIFLGLVDSGVKSRKDICYFLGIDEDSFILNQLNFLLSNEFLEENIASDGMVYYEITHPGRLFFEEEGGDEFIEAAEVDYVIPEIEHIAEEKYVRFFSDLRNL